MKDRKTAFGFGAFVSVVVATSVVVAVFAGPAGTAPVGNRKYTVTLNGASEVPPADLDGTGIGTVKIKGKTGQVCVQFKKVANIAAATMAHIHQGPVGMDGPIVVPLTAPVLHGKKYQKSKTCTFPSAEIVTGLQDNPSAFYLNVHNNDWPGGAIRGQIG